MGAGYSESASSAEWSYWEDGDEAATSATPGPWEIALEDTNDDGVRDRASFSNCIYVRGPITRELEVEDISISGDEYLAAKIDTEAGTAEIISGSSISAVTDSSLPSDSQYIKILLYHLSASGAVDIDYRKAMNLMLYV